MRKGKQEKTGKTVGDHLEEGVLQIHRFIFEFLPSQPAWLKGSGVFFFLSTLGLLLIYPPQSVALNIQYPLGIAILLYVGASFWEFERAGDSQAKAISWWRTHPGALLIMYGSFCYGWFNFFMH